MASGSLAEVFPRDAIARWGKPRASLVTIPDGETAEIVPESRDRSYLFIADLNGVTAIFPTDATPTSVPSFPQEYRQLEFAFPDHGLASTVGWTGRNVFVGSTSLIVVIEGFRIPSLACVCNERDSEFQALLATVNRVKLTRSV